MFLSYLKSRCKVICLVLLITLVFTASNLLFGLPSITVLYPMLLAVAILLVAGCIDYAKMLRVHRRLVQDQPVEEQFENILHSHELLPEPSTVIERDYQTIIKKLQEEEQVARNRAAADYNDMVEYYTVWAHQIKTPIASMRLNLQSEDSDLARRLSSDLNRIEAYVEMVLAFLRLDATSTDFVIRTQDLDDIIRPAIRKFSRECILKKLTMDFQPTGVKVLTDEKWLSFVIEQVISNAVKYTEKGGISIYQRESGVLCIQDTGIGIPAEDLPRIFEQGFTGFNGREDKRASGIGLYLCHRICENLGHGIWAESESAGGTSILLDLSTKPIGIE